MRGSSHIALWSCLIIIGLGLMACTPSNAIRPAEKSIAAEPIRIVSLDFCADQYVLKLASKDRILALSPDATSELSYMREAAAGLPQVRPVGENVLALQPDLIVRTYGGGSQAPALYARAGVPILQIGWAGDLVSIRRVLKEVGAGLGRQDTADKIIQNMDERLVNLASQGNGARALYLTPSGTTTGPGSLMDDMIREAGLANFETRPGWRPLPLEQLVTDQPDLLITAFFDTESQLDQWNLMRHPIAKTLRRDIPFVDLPSAMTACGGWFALDALEAIDQAARDLVAEKSAL